MDKPETPIPPVPKEPGPDEAVDRFLAAYQLDRFSPSFSESLDHGSLSAISKTIYTETGLELVSLTRIPERIENHHLMLAIEPEKSTGTRYLLFWKPHIHIPTYFQGYRGKEIKTLQTLLKKLKLYDYNIDGIVGVKSTRSIVAFQEKYGLEVTGFPDTSTLFLLTRLADPGA